MIKLDKINKKILEVLQENGSITNLDLAGIIGLAPATTLERVKKLEKAGIIIKYVALVDQEKVNKPITAYVEVFINDHSAPAIKLFTKEIEKLSEVLECYHLAGDKDFLLKIVTKDIKTYREFAIENLAIIPNIGKINTMFVLAVDKKKTQIPID